MSIRSSHIKLGLVGQPTHKLLSDTDLALALIGGAPWAYEETWNRFVPLVFNMAVSTLGSSSEAEDIVQEVFCRLARKAKSLRKPESFRSFIVSIAIRVLQWELRRKRAQNWLSFQPAEMLTDVVGISLDIESRDMLRRFYAHMARLGSRERIAYSLRHIESMTIEETAEAMDLSVSTVKRLQERATKQLSEWLNTDFDLKSLVLKRGGCHEG
jgi:RNA polymerase sigma-70 factor (ECF subfamily)